MRERICDITVPLGYSDDLGPSTTMPELEAVLGRFEGIRFQTRIISVTDFAVISEVRMYRRNIPIGIDRTENREHIFTVAYTNLDEYDLDKLPRLVSQIEPGRFVEFAPEPEEEVENEASEERNNEPMYMIPLRFTSRDE